MNNSKRRWRRIAGIKEHQSACEPTCFLPVLSGLFCHTYGLREIPGVTILVSTLNEPGAALSDTQGLCEGAAPTARCPPCFGSRLGCRPTLDGCLGLLTRNRGPASRRNGLAFPVPREQHGCGSSLRRRFAECSRRRGVGAPARGRRSRRCSRTLIALPLALLWIFSAPVVADRMMRSLEDRYPYCPDSAYPVADAVFVLGGGILGARNRPGVDAERGATADRFERALGLYTSGRAGVLVLSAGGPRDSGELGEGARLKLIALQHGVPPDSIILTREMRNTAAEADALAELAVRLHWQRVLLVTSASHMPRAVRLFRKCPAVIIPVPVNYQTPDAGKPSGSGGLDQYLPQAEALARSERACREYLEILFYSVVHREP
jgi:uncharacterized SAM-binding protein YcdF (DUF218 family)